MALTLSSTKLIKHKQTNVLEVNECLTHHEENTTLPKRKHENNTLSDIVWPVDF